MRSRRRLVDNRPEGAQRLHRVHELVEGDRFHDVGIAALHLEWNERAVRVGPGNLGGDQLPHVLHSGLVVGRAEPLWDKQAKTLSVLGAWGDTSRLDEALASLETWLRGV